MRRKKRNKNNFRRKFKVIEILFFIFSLIAFLLLFNAAKHFAIPIDLEKLPLIKRQIGEFKFRPQDPAGLIIMHQNKTIYDNLRSSQKKDNQNHLFLSTKPEDLLSSLKSIYLTNKEKEIDLSNPFEILDNELEESYIICFGTTRTKEAAEIKSMRLAKNYKELAQVKFKILKINKDLYKLEISKPINNEVALNICNKIKLIKEECHVSRLSKN